MWCVMSLSLVMGVRLTFSWAIWLPTTDRIFYIKEGFTRKGPGNLTGKHECESNRP